MANEQKEPGLASLIELIGGLFTALPGLGWVYIGQLETGLKILIGYWLGVIVFAVIVAGLSIVTLGCATPLALAALPIHLLVVITSTRKLHQFITTGYTAPVYIPGYNAPLRKTAMPVTSSPGRAGDSKRSLSGWQVVILIGLAVITTVICLCSALVGLAVLVGRPPT